MTTLYTSGKKCQHYAQVVKNIKEYTQVVKRLKKTTLLIIV